MNEQVNNNSNKPVHISIASLSKISITKFKELGFVLVEGTNKTALKYFEKPITCDKGSGFILIISDIKSYNLDASEERFSLKASLSSFNNPKAVPMIKHRNFEEENKSLLKALKEAGGSLDADKLLSGGYDKVFSVIADFEAEGVFEKMLEQGYADLEEAKTGMSAGRKIMDDYITPTMKSRFPDFSVIENNYDTKASISFTSTKPNKHGQKPRLNFNLGLHME